MPENWLRAIIKLAENFECCPECGDVNDGAIHHHLCSKCKERVSVPDDAYYFAQWLKKEYKIKGKGE